MTSLQPREKFKDFKHFFIFQTKHHDLKNKDFKQERIDTSPQIYSCHLICGIGPRVLHKRPDVSFEKVYLQIFLTTFPSKISLAEINVLWQKQSTYLTTRAAPPSSNRVFTGHCLKPLHEDSNILNVKYIGRRGNSRSHALKTRHLQIQERLMLSYYRLRHQLASLNEAEGGMHYQQQGKKN